MPFHSADRSSSQPEAVACPALEDELAATMPVLPGAFRAGNGNGLHRDDGSTRLPVTVDMTGNAPAINGAYIYGYDSAGDPTLTDAPDSCSSDRYRPR